MDNVRIGYVFIAMMKQHEHNNLQNKEFVWAYGSRGLRVHYCWEVWQQTTKALFEP